MIPVHFCNATPDLDNASVGFIVDSSPLFVAKSYAMFEDFITHLTVLEGLGTLFAIGQVMLSRNNNVNNYLFGIAGILISIYVRYHAKLYGDILLDLYYLVMSIYGWFFWKFGKQNHQAPISFSTRRERSVALLIVVGCFLGMYYWLEHYTNTDVPLWDALVSAFAWAGMWLMAKRKMENWIFLNISNLIAIPLLIYKGLYIYTGLTVFLFVMGISGYLKWHSIVKKRKEQVAVVQ